MIATPRRPARLLALAAACILAGLAPVHAANTTYRWDADGNIAAGTPAIATPGSGTWNTTDAKWNTGASPSSNIAWENGNVAQFGSTAATAFGPFAIDVDSSVTSLGANSSNSIVFSSSGFTLGASSSRSIALTGGVSVNSAATATLGNNIHLTGATHASAAGRLILDSGSSITSGSGDFTIGNMEIKTGASLTAATRVLVNGGPGQSLLVSGGTLSFGGTALFLGQGTDNDMTATLSSGAITATSATAANGVMQLGSTGGSNVSTGTFNLDGGTLTLGQIKEGGSTGTTSAFNFNGGTLKVKANTSLGSTFMQGLDTANIRNGGARIDTNGVNITIAQSLVHSTLDGDAAIDGGLTKLGTGKLTLTGASTFTGGISVQGGTLSIQSAFINDTSDVSIAAGAVFDLNFTGTDTIGALFFDGEAQALGTYGSIGSTATYQSAFFTGNGLLNVTVFAAVPEPSTCAALAGIIALTACVCHRRSRRLA